MTLFSVHLDPTLVVIVNDEQNVPAISPLLESDTSLISTRDASGDGGKALAPTDLASEPIAPPPPTAASTTALRNGSQVLKKGMPIRVPMLQRARTSTFWTRDKDKRSQAVNSAKASNSLSLKLSSYVVPLPLPKEVPPAAPVPEEKPLDEPVILPAVERPPIQPESYNAELPKVDAQSSLSSLLQPILSLFPPPQSTALAPAIDLETPDAPPSPTLSEKDEIGDKTVGGDGLEPFTIHRPRVLEPVREATAARKAYTFDWKIDVFGDSPVAVKGQRTKYPKHHQPPTSNAPVLPPIPACPPLDFDATSSTSPPPQRVENLQKDKLKKKESVDSLRRNIQSPLLPLALYRAARRNRSRSTASIGTMFSSSSSGLPTSFLRLFSASDARTSSFATFFSDPSLVSVTSGVSSFEQDELMTPFGSEVMLGYHHAVPAGVRFAKDRDYESVRERERDDDQSQSRRTREAGRTSPSLDLSSPTSSIRRAIDAMGLASPSIPMELVDALRSNPELHTFFSEDTLAEDMELSNALANYAQAQSHRQDELETEDMESLQEHEQEEEHGEEVEMHTGTTPHTPSTDRSVPEDDSDDD